MTLLAGCVGSKSDATVGVPTRGKALLGDKPASGAVLIFHGPNAGLPPRALVQADGQFEVPAGGGLTDGELEKKIKTMYAAAKVYRTRNSVIDMDLILNVGGFDLDRAMDYDPQFLEPEYPFEWGGVFQLDAGQYEFVCGDGPDPAMNAVLLKSTSGDDAGRKAVEHDAVLTYSESEREVGPGESIADLTDHTSTISDSAWKPNSDILAVLVYGGVMLWTIRGEDSPTFKLFPRKGSPLRMCWSPNAAMLAHGNQDSTVHFWYAETAEKLQMSGFPTKVRELSWDPTRSPRLNPLAMNAVGFAKFTHSAVGRRRSTCTASPSCR